MVQGYNIKFLKNYVLVQKKMTILYQQFPVQRILQPFLIEEQSRMKYQ